MCSTVHLRGQNHRTVTLHLLKVLLMDIIHTYANSDLVDIHFVKEDLDSFDLCIADVMENLER